MIKPSIEYKQIKQLLDKKTGYVLRELDMGIIMGLVNWGHDMQNEGWKEMKQIIEKNPFWKSQPTNFPRYIKKLERIKVVESQQITIESSKYYTKHPFVWRLKRDFKTFETMHYWCLCYDITGANYSELWLNSDYFKNFKEFQKKLDSKIVNRLKAQHNQSKNSLLAQYKLLIESIIRSEIELYERWNIDVFKLRYKEFESILNTYEQRYQEFKKEHIDEKISYFEHIKQMEEYPKKEGIKAQ